MLFQPSLFAHINNRYHAFKSEVLKVGHCETAQFWARYMDIIQMVLTLIWATRKTTLNCMSALSYLYALSPMFVAHDHNNYAQYVTVHTSQMQRTSQTKFSLVFHNHWFFA